MRLPLRHLPALPQHGSAGARVAGYSDHIVVYIPCHTIPSLIILPECEALAASERRWQDGLVPSIHSNEPDFTTGYDANELKPLKKTF